MKYIIAIVVVVVGNAILLSISHYLGALLTAILSGGLIVWGFYYSGIFSKEKDAKLIEDKVKFKKTKNTKVEEEVEEEVEKEVEEEKGWGFIHYFIGFVVVGILLQYLFDVNIFKLLESIIKGAIEGFNEGNS